MRQESLDTWGGQALMEEEGPQKENQHSKINSREMHFWWEWVCFSGASKARSNKAANSILMGPEGQEQMATASSHIPTPVCLYFPVLGNPHWPRNLPAPSDGFCVLFSWFLPGGVPEKVNICLSWVISTCCCNQSHSIGWAGSMGPFCTLSVHRPKSAYCP